MLLSDVALELQENEILKMLSILESEIDSLEYGSIVVTVELKGGIPDLNSITIAKSKRRKYSDSKDKND